MSGTATAAYVERSFRDALAETWPGTQLPAAGDGFRVVLGSGDVAPDSWVCVDRREDYPLATPHEWERIEKRRRGRIRFDVTRVGNRFAPGSCSALYAHHVVEHLPIAGWSSTLSSWAAMLRPGGLIYLSQPDLEAVAARTLEGISQGSASAWFDADPVSRTWKGESYRGLDPVRFDAGSFGAWEWLYCGGAHLSVPSELHVREALESEGVEVRRARFDLSKVDVRYRRFVALCATYVGRKQPE